MTNGGGPGHHAKPKKKPASKKTTGAKARKWVPSALKKASERNGSATGAKE